MPPESKLFIGEPTEVAKQFESSLLEIGIPPCPVILALVTAEIRKEEPDFSHLVSIISADVAISASLIKTANSPYFGRQTRVRSVNDALTVLGLTLIGSTIAGIVLRKVFPESQTMTRFWDSSARIARISAWLAHKLDIPELQAEEVYAFGLFRDCGIPVLFTSHPSYLEVLEVANNEKTASFTEIETATFAIHHAAVGSVLAQNWWLPEDVQLAIRAHHNLPALASKESLLPMRSRQMIAIAQFAEHLIQRQLGLSHTEEWLKLGNACLKLLRIDEYDLEFIYTEAHPIVSQEGGRA